MRRWLAKPKGENEDDSQPCCDCQRRNGLSCIGFGLSRIVALICNSGHRFILSSLCQRVPERDLDAGFCRVPFAIVFRPAAKNAVVIDEAAIGIIMQVVEGLLARAVNVVARDLISRAWIRG